MLVTWQSFHRIFFIAIRESFIALMPYLIFNSLLALILAFVKVWQPDWQYQESYIWFSQLNFYFHSFFPLLTLVSLSFHFAKYLHLSPIVVSSLSIASLVALHVHPQDTITNFANFTEMLADPRVIIIPLVMAYILKKILVTNSFETIKNTSLNNYLKLHFNLFIPMVMSFISATLLIYILSYGIEILFERLIEHLSHSSLLVQLSFKTMIIHLLWCFGVHGGNNFLLVMGPELGLQEIYPNLTISGFLDLFIFFGGSGGTLSLIIAIFIASKDKVTLNIAKLASPFSLFNINEILIFGLPIIFNPRLIIPFILLPALNIMLGYIALSLNLLSFNGQPFAWITPPLLNAYIASDNFSVVIFQALLIVIGVMVYLPFIKHFKLLKRKHHTEHQLITKIDMQDSFARLSELDYSNKQLQQVAHSHHLQKSIEEVLEGELIIYYQPKVMTNNRQVSGFEALLRLKNRSGKIVGPYFIKSFDDAGYAKLIDEFVINRVAQDLQQWQQEGFYPKISINLNPNNIMTMDTQQLLRSKLGFAAKDIEIELLESAFMQDLNQINNCINQLKSNGFTFLLDDFGTGFSSLSLLSKINIDGVKLDRTILENTANKQGQMLYTSICLLCKNLGFNLVAEGVEIKSEAEFVKEAGVDYIQGWLYAKAMPMAEAKQFALNKQPKVSNQSI